MLDVIMIWGLTWDETGRGAIKEMSAQQEAVSGRVHSVRYLRWDSQSDMIKFDVSVLIFLPQAHHLLHQRCRCSSLSRLMIGAALITAGVKL